VDDARAIGELIEEAYAALAFPPGAEPDWNRFNAVFHPDAVLALRVFPGDPAIRIMRLPAYAAAQMENQLGDQGYSETPGERRTEIHGDIATVYQHFTMNFAGSTPRQAIDAFSLARAGGNWIIVSVLSDLR
jgi:hypothetical protein